MIRRNVTLDDGRPGWALVSQVEHAHIAMEMARAWSGGVAPLPEAREEFVAAVLHHDDGWIAWELRPTVHGGVPRDFLEMPLDEALAIWRRSIAVALNDGPLAAYAVSRHFATLCGQSHDEKPHDAAWRHLAEEFLEEQAELEQDWKREVSTRYGSAEAGAQQSLLAWQGLRFFDLASLWLCCAERRAAERVGHDDFVQLTWSPAGTDDGGTDLIRVGPWPFQGNELSLAVSCRTIPAGNYATDQALADVLHSDACGPGELAWKLLPG